MKPQMLLKMRISIDSAQKQRYTEEEINLEFVNDNIKIERKYIKTNELFQFGHSLTHKGNRKNPKHYKVIHDTIYAVRSK